MSELYKKFNFLVNKYFGEKIRRKLLITFTLFFYILNLIESRVKVLSPPELKDMFGGIK